MQQPAGDDFSAFAGREHMMFGLREPFVLMREVTESTLRKQVADTKLARIATYGEPKFLTLGRERKRWFRKMMLVTHHGFCVRGRLEVTYDGGTKSATLDAVLTFFFGDVDRRGSESSRSYLDLDADAERAFTDEVFQKRFLAFRVDPDTPV